MSNWIQLNPDSLNKVTTESHSGVTVTIGMSPYDLPEAVRGKNQERIGRFVIYFKYLGRRTEGIRPARHNEYVTCMIGEHSGRLYQVRIDMKAVESNHVTLKMLVPKVSETINVLQKMHPDRKKNYGVARDVIQENTNQLFELVNH
ncbi:hypothetical protein SH668x_001014 [Planctomicrobium sp. SH668]|uniref:hypothetical protein n=1 Tax=Planctomicrobium sp. SH668 TaxID=3448126 RepID=UPI003F5B9AB6